MLLPDGVALSCRLRGACDQRFVVVARIVEATTGRGKMRQHGLGKLQGGSEIARVETSFDRSRSGRRSGRRSPQVAIEANVAIFVRAQQPPFVHQVVEQEVGVADCRLFIVIAPQDTGSFGEAGKHQAVPRRQDFLVAGRVDALLTGRVQFLPRLLQNLKELVGIQAELLGGDPVVAIIRRVKNIFPSKFPVLLTPQ